MMRSARRRAFGRRFARARRGAVAVEFAMVAAPFLVLLFGIVELAVMFIATTTLENATEQASRRIRTGEFQSGAAATKEDFRILVCNGMSWLSTDCLAGKLSVDVETFNDFPSMAADIDANPATFDPNATCFSPGKATDIVLVRTYYQWTLFVPLMNKALVNAGSDKRLLTFATTFRNEPYSSDPKQGAKCT